MGNKDGWHLINNATIHYYSKSPYIARALVHLKSGKKIVSTFAMYDIDAARGYLARHSLEKIPVKIFMHKAGAEK